MTEGNSNGMTGQEAMEALLAGKAIVAPGVDARFIVYGKDGFEDCNGQAVKLRLGGVGYRLFEPITPTGQDLVGVLCATGDSPEEAQRAADMLDSLAVIASFDPGSGTYYSKAGEMFTSVVPIWSRDVNKLAIAVVNAEANAYHREIEDAEAAELAEEEDIRDPQED